MVGVLLNFLSAERDANWKLHLETFGQTLFYDRAYDHLKYFKWGSVYYIDMKRLPTTHQDLHDAFLNDFHVVSRSKSPNKFNCVFTDRALEQSMNQDTKTKGGTYCRIISRCVITHSCEILVI